MCGCLAYVHVCVCVCVWGFVCARIHGAMFAKFDRMCDTLSRSVARRFVMMLLTQARASLFSTQPIRTEWIACGSACIFDAVQSCIQVVVVVANSNSDIGHFANKHIRAIYIISIDVAIFNQRLCIICAAITGALIIPI